MNQFDMEELCKRFAPVIAASISSSYRDARLTELRFQQKHLLSELSLIQSEIKVLELLGGAK